MDELIANGIELQRNYAHKYCSPTRSAIQSGRHPMHVNVMNIDPNFYNPEDFDILLGEPDFKEMDEKTRDELGLDAIVERPSSSLV